MVNNNNEIRQFNEEHQKSDKKIMFTTISILLFIATMLFVGIGIGANTYFLMTKINNFELQLIDFINNKTAESDWEIHKNGTNDLLGNLQQNKIMNRTDWGAVDSTKPLGRLKLPINTVIIGYTDTSSCTDSEPRRLQMNMLQLFCIDLSKLKDIGYNFLIGGDGVVYESFGWKFTGNHTYGHNQNSIGIGFIRNYPNVKPTDKQLDAAKHLLIIGLENNYLDKNYTVKGQTDLLPIVSPGKNLYSRIMDWDHYYKKF